MKVLERLPTERELSPAVEVLARKFIQRWDMYPRQLNNGQYITVHEPMHIGLIFAHLRGEITLGTYLLNDKSQGRFLVLDADDRNEWRRLVATARILADEGAGGYLERSRRGGHLWLFFDQWLPGQEIRRFGFGFIEKHKLGSIELYPKQDSLDDGPGSLIRLPFGVHRKAGRRYCFYYPDGNKLAPTIHDQLTILEHPKIVSQGMFDHYQHIAPEPSPKPPLVVSQGLGEHVSDRIKSAITVRNFVNQYVDLTPSGRGHCPFHDDKVKSFSVNDDKNYWSCFAGCGGGSLIDFYMMYQKRVEGRECDFKTAVTELAKLLL